MSDSDAPEQESIDPTTIASDAISIGVDKTGATHYYSRINETVTVIHGHGTDHRQDLEGHTLSSWIAYVDIRRGWSQLNYAESFTDVLLEALGATNGDDR